jgi:hypothetical protein
LGGLPVLTDGLIGPIGGGSFSALVAAGSASGGATATYTLGSGNGFNLSSIVIYGGWQDDGRDEQSYTISCSTPAAPNTFAVLRALSHTAALSGGDPNGTRLTFTPSAGGYLATNVAKVLFNFTTPSGQENSWQGYSEIDIYGVVAVPPTINAPSVAGGNLILTGTGGQPGATYNWLTTTNLALPLTAWTTNTSGVFSASGAFSNAIPINPAQPAGFFVLEFP